MNDWMNVENGSETWTVGRRKRRTKSGRSGPFYLQTKLRGFPSQRRPHPSISMSSRPVPSILRHANGNTLRVDLQPPPGPASSTSDGVVEWTENLGGAAAEGRHGNVIGRSPRIGEEHSGRLSSHRGTGVSGVRRPVAMHLSRTRKWKLRQPQPGESGRASAQPLTFRHAAGPSAPSPMDRLSVLGLACPGSCPTAGAGGLAASNLGVLCCLLPTP